MESTTGYIFTPFVRYFTSERLIINIIAHSKKGPTALVSLPKDIGKVGVSFLCNLFADNYCCALVIMHHVMLAFTVVSSTF